MELKKAGNLSLNSPVSLQYEKLSHKCFKIYSLLLKLL